MDACSGRFQVRCFQSLVPASDHVSVCVRSPNYHGQSAVAWMHESAVPVTESQGRELGLSEYLVARERESCTLHRLIWSGHWRLTGEGVSHTLLVSGGSLREYMAHDSLKTYVCILYCSPCAPLMAPWLGELEGTSLAIA